MTDKELYKLTFSQLHASARNVKEEKPMKVHFRKSMAIALAATALLATAASAANIATDGAIFEQVRLFINGQPANVEEYLQTDEQGRQFISYEDEDGNKIAVTPSPEWNDSNSDLHLGKNAPKADPQGTPSIDIPE